MKPTLLLCALLFLSACGGSPTTPAKINAMVTSPGPDFRADGNHSPIATALPPSPPECIPASYNPQPPSCDWRDLVVCQHIAFGGKTNDIVTLSNGHRVFIQDAAGTPGVCAVRQPDRLVYEVGV